MSTPKPGSSTVTNPYVGPRPFLEDDERAFAGRSHEVADLASLLVAHRVVVLHADSGTGKSSLCNAGLVPALRKRGWRILESARIGNVQPSGTGNPYITDVLASLHFDPKTSFEESVKHLHAACAEEQEEGAAAPRLLVVDQLEELFTFVVAEQQRHVEGFFTQLSKLIDADASLRLLLVTRNDHLATLLRYAAWVPEELQIRYDLERLTRAAALAAMTKPLEGTGVEFGNGVADFVVEQLSYLRSASGEVPGPYVEPVQLQVVCSEIWAALPPGTAQIERKHLQGTADVSKALARFYDRVVLECARRERVFEGSLRRWIGQKLITDIGTRWAVAAGPERTAGLQNRVVKFLVNRHLLRGEYRAAALQYELSHDRLIQPIRDANAEWYIRHPWYLVNWKRATLPLILVAALAATILAFATELRAENSKAKAAIALEWNSWNRRLNSCADKARGVAADSLAHPACDPLFQQLGSELLDLQAGGENDRLTRLNEVLDQHQQHIPASFGLAEIAVRDWRSAKEEPNPEFTLEYSTQLSAGFNADDFDARFRELARAARQELRIDMPSRVRVQPNPDVKVQENQIRLVIEPNCVLPGASAAKVPSLPRVEQTITLLRDSESSWVAPESSPEALSDPRLTQPDPKIRLRSVRRRDLPLLVAKGLRAEPLGAVVARQVVALLLDNPGMLFTCRALGRALAAQVELGHQSLLVEALHKFRNESDLLPALADIQKATPGLLDTSFFDALASENGDRQQTEEELTALRTQNATNLAKLDATRLKSRPRPVKRDGHPSEVLAFANALLASRGWSSWLADTDRAPPLARGAAGSALANWRVYAGSALYGKLVTSDLDWNEDELGPLLGRQRAWFRQSALVVPLPALQPDVSLRPNDARVETLNRPQAESTLLKNATRESIGTTLQMADPVLETRYLDPDAASAIVARMSEPEQGWLLKNFSVTDLKLLLRATFGTGSASSQHTEWLLRSLLYFYDPESPVSLEDLAVKLRAVRPALEAATLPAPSADLKRYSDAIAKIATAPSDAAASLKSLAGKDDAVFARALAVAARTRLAERIKQQASKCEVDTMRSALRLGSDRGDLFELEELVELAPRVEPNLAQSLQKCLLGEYGWRHLAQPASALFEELTKEQGVEGLSPTAAAALAVSIRRAFSAHTEQPNPAILGAFRRLLAIVFSQPGQWDAYSQLTDGWSIWSPPWLRTALTASMGEKTELDVLTAAAQLISRFDLSEGRRLLALAHGANESMPRKRGASSPGTGITLALADAQIELEHLRQTRGTSDRAEIAQAIISKLLKGADESPRAIEAAKKEYAPEEDQLVSLLAQVHTAANDDAAALKLLDAEQTGTAQDAAPKAPKAANPNPCQSDRDLSHLRVWPNLGLGHLADARQAALCNGSKFARALTAVLLDVGDLESEVADFLAQDSWQNKDNMILMTWWCLRKHGHVAQADALLRARWVQIDAGSWPTRLESGDPRVWGEQLIGAAAASLGEPTARSHAILPGAAGERPNEPPTQLLGALGYQPHELSCEANFYTGIIAWAVADPDDGTGETYMKSLRSAVQADAVDFWEYRLARYFLSVRSFEPSTTSAAGVNLSALNSLSTGRDHLGTTSVATVPLAAKPPHGSQPAQNDIGIGF